MAKQKTNPENGQVNFLVKVVLFTTIQKEGRDSLQGRGDKHHMIRKVWQFHFIDGIINYLFFVYSIGPNER